MQHFRGFLFFATVFLTGLFTLAAPAARAQDDPFVSDVVLAQGDPPLTESMVARFTNFSAWLFEIPFTQQQRERLRAMLLQDWKKPEEMKNDISWLSIAAVIAKQAPDQLDFIRLDFQSTLLEKLRADKNRPDAQWLAAAYDEAHRPIAAGNPPLTESMVSHYITFVGWLFEIPLTQPLKDRQRAMLLEDWKKPKDLESDMTVLNWQLEMAHYKNGPAERDYVRSLAQPDLIKKMRSRQANSDAQSLVTAYDAAHRPLAAGNPPLTREASDAWTDIFCFVRNQSGAPHLEATQAVKDDFAHALTENWAKYPPEQQKDLAEMPQKWAMLRLAWLTGKDADRQKILASWQPAVNPSQPADPRLTAALEAQARVNAFENKDANTVSDQELLRAAKDAEIVALEWRREGYLATAPQWEQLARDCHAGKEAYVKRQAGAQANANMMAIMLMQDRLQTNQHFFQAAQNILVQQAVVGQNIAAHIGNSSWEVVLK
jgi:hypothetical protein